MPPKRAPLKMNSVTGKWEEAAPLKAGQRRDGCVSIDEKYMQAALDAGLGGANGMYGHITSINKVRGGSGVSKGAEPSTRGGIRQGVQGSSRSVSTTSRDNRRMGDDVSFTKRKGVINTFGGAKDVTRLPKASKDDAGMRKSDRLKSSGIHTISGPSSSAPRGGSADSNRARKGGLHTFSTLEHDSKVGLRKGDGVGGGAGASVSSAPRTGVSDLGSIRVEAPKKKPFKKKKQASSGVAGGSPPVGHVIKAGGRSTGGSSTSGGGGGRPAIVRKLGGGASKVGGGDARSDREKRLAFFDKKA